MRRFVLLLAGMAVCVVLAPASPASAITNGVPDNGAHPYVGGLVSHDPDTGERYLICSATLIAPKVVLTAAHCLVDEPADLEVAFDAFVGAPDLSPDVTQIYKGTAVGHPRFTDEHVRPEPYDLAVLRLDTAVEGISPARLPEANLLRHLKRVRKKDAKGDDADDHSYRGHFFTNVGYGREGFDADNVAFGGGSRLTSVSGFRSLTRSLLYLDQREQYGFGGTCNGDSGGPNLLDDSDVIVGVVSDGDTYCRRTDISERTDTKVARAFLASYVSLPGGKDEGENDD